LNVSALLLLPPELAVRRLALAQLDIAAATSARVLARDDAQALHDFRVALRRLRSLLRAYAPWCRPVPKPLRKRLRRLARATNTARDLETQIGWLCRRSARFAAEVQPARAWWCQRLGQRQHSAQRAVRKLVRKEFAVLEPRLRAALRIPADGRNRATAVDMTFAQATDERLKTYCTDLAADLVGIGAVTDRDAIHAARITGKRLRYLLEPLRGSVSGTTALVNTLKAFQDHFGELHDRFVAGQEIAQALEIAEKQDQQLVPGLRELAAWLKQDTEKQYRDIRVRYLGRHARKLLAPIRAWRAKLVVMPAINGSKPRAVRLK
jgi:CHAD domain-containing protein